MTTTTSKARITSPEFQDEVSSLQEEDHDDHLYSLDSKEDDRDYSDSVTIIQMKGGDSLASKGMEFQEPERIRTKKPSDWKLGYFSLWWLRMARESTNQKETKSMKKMTTFFQLYKIQNEKIYSEVTCK